MPHEVKATAEKRGIVRTRTTRRPAGVRSASVGTRPNTRTKSPPIQNEAPKRWTTSNAIAVVRPPVWAEACEIKLNGTGSAIARTRVIAVIDLRRFGHHQAQKDNEAAKIARRRIR